MSASKLFHISGEDATLPLTSLNHISLICRSVQKSLDFYQNLLGFFPIRRPGSFDFDGAWLFNYGIGIHLIQSEQPESMPMNERKINFKDNHISFQCDSFDLVEKMLNEIGIKYLKNTVEEGGILVDQIFFHDPDGFMIEICNCENLPVIPLPEVENTASVCNRVSCLKQQQQQKAGLSPAITVKEQDSPHISCS